MNKKGEINALVVILLVFAVAVGAWFARGYMTKEGYVEPEPVKAPIQLDVWAHQRDYVKQYPETQVFSSYPAHWQDCIVHLNEKGERSDGNTYGSWYQVCEGLPAGEQYTITSSGGTQVLRTNDDYTSPIILIHDGAQLWNSIKGDQWMVAVMMMDGCQKSDIYLNDGGERLLLWGNLTSCVDGIQQPWKPIGKLVMKKEEVGNQASLVGLPIERRYSVQDVDFEEIMNS